MARLYQARSMPMIRLMVLGVATVALAGCINPEMRYAAPEMICAESI